MQGWIAGLLALMASVAVPSPATAQSSPSYVLSPREVATIRAIETNPDRYGEGFHVQVASTTPLGRVIAHIADKRGGRYSGNNWSVQQTFYEFMSIPPHIIDRDDRFLVATGCRHHSCPEKASVIIDLETGHVAFALLHYVSAEGRDLGRSAGLTRFMKTCADREFRDFAEKRFVAWAEAELDELGGHIPGGLDEGEIKTLTTRC